MSAYVNDRDNIITGAQVRKVVGPSNSLLLVPSANPFYVTQAGAHSPDVITVKVVPVLVDGPFTFTAQGATLSNITPTSADVAYSTVTGTTAVITVNAANAGAPVSQSCLIGVVKDGASGQSSSGARGAGQYYATNGQWSDAVAQAATPGGVAVTGDVVTISNGGTYALTKRWDGDSWEPIGAVFDGSLFVTGSIDGAALRAGSVTIYNPDGSIALAAGGQLNLKNAASGTVNNYTDLSWWKKGTACPWTPYGETSTLYIAGVDAPVAAIKGPKGDNDVIFYTKESTGTDTPGGGWGDAPLHLDPTKTYRFVLPVRRLSGTGSTGWGVSNVANLNHVINSGGTYVGTDKTFDNPYFALAQFSKTDRWYLIVGYIYPAGTTNNTNDSSGVWDCKSGTKLASITNFNFHYGNGEIFHWANQRDTSNGAEQLFGKPLVSLVDGTEPSLNGYFEGAQLGVNVGGQITSANSGTYIANAAINLAHINTASIGSLSAVSAIIGTFRTSTSGPGVQISDNGVKVVSTNGANIRIGSSAL